MTLVDVHLHGPLADKYGAKHRLAIGTPHEAVRALDANFPGFVRDFAATRMYHVLADGDWLDGDEAAGLPVGRELHLVPQIEGRVEIAALLVGALFPALATTTVLGISAATLIGGALFLGVMVGLSFLFRPKVPKQGTEERNESFAFTGPENVVTQGAPIPLAYGTVHCGSVVVSAGQETAELEEWVEAKGNKNELRSKQFAKIIDVVSDGVIVGFSEKEIYLDGVVLMNDDGSRNFENTKIQIVKGTRSQPIMSGFQSQQTEVPVGLEVDYGTPLVQAITNLDVDRARITLSVPALQRIDSEGKEHGSTAPFRVEMQNDGGAWVKKFDHEITGNTSSRYQRNYILNLPRPGPWNIRISRTAKKDERITVQHDLYWDSFTELVDDRINYNGTAAVGLQLDSEQFSSIPKRTYLVTGLTIQVPDNYDPESGSYDGVWSGAFKSAHTSNPAWILYDLLVSKRHGIGNFLTAAQIDKWALYRISQWCDQKVNDGNKGKERRFTCNVQITDQQEAFDLIAEIAGVFRGFTYWSGTSMVAVADQPDDPVYQFTNANVIDGIFTYSGSDLRGRHTTATVAWNDPKQLGQPRLSIVEDHEAIARYGIQEAEIDALGCTSEAQAIRTGRWALYTELYEGEAATFSTGLESAFVRPGEIVQVMDANVAGKRRGGRVAAGSTATKVYIEAAIGAHTPSGGPPMLSCLVGTDAVMQTRAVAAFLQDAGGYYFDMSDPFTAAPLPDSVWIYNETGDLEPTLWRVISVRQADVDKYEISGVRHFPGKWAYVEKNIPLSEPDISDIKLVWPAVQSMAVREYLTQTSAISVGVRVVLSWVSGAPSFEVAYKPKEGNWQTTRTDAKAIDLPVTEGPYIFRVVPISALGVRGIAATLAYTVIGRFALPAAPKQFRINVVEGIAMFDWLPAAELDVIIGGHFQLRHTTTVNGATWGSAQIVIPSIPGSATSAETGYQPGSWMLRTYDITGRASSTWAAVIGYQQDTRYFQWHQVCEDPDWLGAKVNTDIKLPEQWLVIQSVNTGLWDEQLDPIDSWAGVDALPVPPGTPPGDNSGSYKFSDRFDAGAPFSIRFSSDILAFPFGDPGDFLDSRFDDCDDWQDWDNLSEDYGGQVTILIRSTLDDPVAIGAVWSDWKTFIAGEHYGRGFEFQAVLTAPAGQNIGIERLCILGDFKNKYDEGADVAYPAADTAVYFRIKFYNVPAVVVTLQQALSTDTITIVEKTREYFKLRVTPQSVRSFDWHAQGY